MKETRNDSSKAIVVQQSISILNQAVNKLQENDYVSAQVMIGVAKHLLDEVQIDLDHYLTIQRLLKDTFKS
ncbi:hypothetical protein NIES2119_15550 [[Phormidium ambiguum] IAM M-71]|uniref:Uncharacterized protein n=1 Tax=[Phormidium ambiguum] IAM M-71 TaxID=454136 RepID=A0A1U7IIB2_9CYAN|nr:hypothetical protein [Phormidium ambiguum]OKH36834.1 hypothetical protein NIES2119_15550 [Phormidium ambiguum IAM M-71]